MQKQPSLPPIRKIQPREVEGLIQMVASFPKGPGFSWSEDKLRSELVKAEAWALWENNTMKAFILFRDLPDAFEVSVLGTEVNSRGQGYMKTLFQHVFNAHCHKDWWLEVHDGNESAINLYLSLGFSETGRRKNYYPDGAQALLMTLDRKVL